MNNRPVIFLIKIFTFMLLVFFILSFFLISIVNKDLILIKHDTIDESFYSDFIYHTTPFLPPIRQVNNWVKDNHYLPDVASYKNFDFNSKKITNYKDHILKLIIKELGMDYQKINFKKYFSSNHFEINLFDKYILVYLIENKYSKTEKKEFIDHVLFSKYFEYLWINAHTFTKYNSCKNKLNQTYLRRLSFIFSCEEESYQLGKNDFEYQYDLHRGQIVDFSNVYFSLEDGINIKLVLYLSLLLLIEISFILFLFANCALIIKYTILNKRL